MNALPLVTEKATRDGCGCPDVVECCVHFDGFVIVMFPHLNDTPGFIVSTHSDEPDVWAFCSQCLPQGHWVYDYGDKARYQAGLSHAAALAAFHEAEARLLGREALRDG